YAEKQGSIGSTECEGIHEMRELSRRSFLKMAAALGATAAIAKPAATRSGLAWNERREFYPEGVASGDPDSSSVLLWTRRPSHGADTSNKLTLEVSEDEAFSRIVATAETPVSAASDWTCRVLVGGLKPARVYWYRFSDLDGNGSRIGRTITAPSEND